MGPETLDACRWVRPWTPTVGTLEHGNQKYLRGTRFLGPLKWDPGPGTPKYSSGTWDLGPPKWDPESQNIQVGPRTPKVGPRDPKRFNWNLGLSTFYTCYKILILTYFVANLQKQPLRCDINFKQL